MQTSKTDTLIQVIWDKSFLVYLYYKSQKIIIIFFIQNLEDNWVKHGTEALYNVWCHQHFDTLFQMTLGILIGKENYF